MKLSILHFSDLHLKDDTNLLIAEADEIAGFCFDDYRNSDCCLIIITGDIAYSGLPNEYAIAKDFLTKIIETLTVEKNIPISVAIVPGNHDCNFSENNSVRDIVIESVRNDPTKAKDKNCIDLCTSIQKDFFLFRDEVSTGLNFIHKDNLWSEADLTIENKKIGISLINASWMSSRRESSGSLVFPIDEYEKLYARETDYKFTAIHHPINWYCQDSYHPLRKVIQTESSIVFSGHEHTATDSVISSNGSNGTVYLAARSLDPHVQGGESGFFSILLDLDKGAISRKDICKKDKQYQVIDDDIIGNVLNKTTGYELNESFVKMLRDPGANLSLPDKDEIDIKDIYISPELESRQTGEVIEFDAIDIIGKKIFISGSEVSGKTKILHTAFSKLYDENYFPVLIDAKNIKRFTKDGIQKTVHKALLSQYTNVTDLLGKKKSSLALLVDNYETIASLTKGLAQIFEYIEDNFETIILTCNNIIDPIFEARGVSSSFVGSFNSYVLKDFGCTQRYKLIKKWHSSRPALSIDELDHHICKSEKIISSVLGKNLVPSRPLYLLTLLQSTSSHAKSELNNSGMSYYYQYLITRSLAKAGVRRTSYDEMFNYLSNLAWFFKENGFDNIEEHEINRFNEFFSREYTTVNLHKQLSVLVKAKILLHDNGLYSFYYPYIKYFFLGKYFADHLDRSDIISETKDYCKDLSSRDSSNLILFLTHHKNSEWVMDLVADNLNACFSENRVVGFGDDVSYLNDLIGSVSEIVISDLNVEENQERCRQAQDKMSYEPTDQELKEKVRANETGQGVVELFRLIRSTEVLGQIVKNYYGSILRSKKQRYLQEVADGPLRLLDYILQSMLNDPEKLVSRIEEEIRKRNKGLTRSEVHSLSSKLIAEFIGMICTGIVGRAAEAIGSDKLREDIDQLVSNNNNKNSYKIIQAATYLITPNNVHMDKLRDLAARLRNNPLGLKVMQNLVLYHIHMFHTSDKLKQQLGSLVNINLKGARSIALSSKKQ